MRTDIYLAVTAERNRRSTASDLSRQLSSATGTTASRQTVHRRLGHIGLYACRPVRCVPPTATHCRLRLTWSLVCSLILVGLYYGERQVPVTTKRTPLNDTVTVVQDGLCVWGGIILDSRTDLHVQSVTMTVHIYRNVILEQHVRLFRGAMGAEFLFMDDNARPHRANIGEIIDSIEQHVIEASEDVRDGNKEITSAAKKNAASRKIPHMLKCGRTLSSANKNTGPTAPLNSPVEFQHNDNTSLKGTPLATRVSRSQTIGFLVCSPTSLNLHAAEGLIQVPVAG
ncbi:transposable element Tcb2 transposase [Trichonephila clavipes]|nr:transposable element Tcb2 transposase [Trichonephila clavipes]